MTAVHQFVPALLPRDATGDHTRALRDALRAAGFNSDIFVEAAHDELQAEATYFEEYPSRAQPGDILLYQLGTSSPVAEFLLGRPEPLVLDYHNVTPEEFYAGWEEHTREKVALARAQVAELAPAAVLGIADSEFNASELATLGCPATEVVPILVDLAAITADAAEADRLAKDHGRGTVWLFVGRISPNKVQHRLVAAFWLYRQMYDADARLHLVGPAVTPDYVDALDAYVAELGLTDAVRRVEGLSAGQLAAWYEDADVFVCLSEHEGFCIPLLEAMAAGTPVVALDAGAVGETLGRAGLLLDSSRPSVVAAAVDRVRCDHDLVEHLVAAGRRRLADFAAPVTAARFVDVLRRLDTERSQVA